MQEAQGIAGFLSSKRPGSLTRFRWHEKGLPDPLNAKQNVAERHAEQDSMVRISIGSLGVQIDNKRRTHNAQECRGNGEQRKDFVLGITQTGYLGFVNDLPHSFVFNTKQLAVAAYFEAP